MQEPFSLSTPERRRDYEEFCEDAFHRDDDEVMRKRLELAWLRGMGDLYRRIARGEEPGYGLLSREEPEDTEAVEIDTWAQQAVPLPDRTNP